MLTNPKIRAYLDARIEELSEPWRIQQERVLRELRSVAFSNMADLVEWSESSVKLKDSSQLTREQTAAISQVTQVHTRYGASVNIKTHDKPEALTRLGNNLRLFEEDKLKDINIAIQVVSVR